MATHSSILAWRMPWTEEPGGLQSMGLQRVRHDWLTQTYLILSSTCIITLHLFHISFMAIIYIIFYHFQKLFAPHILNVRKWLLPPFYSWRNGVSERLNDADTVTWQWSRSVFCPFIPPAFHCTFCSSLLWKILELGPEWCLSVESIHWPHLDKFLCYALHLTYG